jgi:hypothetical protein
LYAIGFSDGCLMLGWLCAARPLLAQHKPPPIRTQVPDAGDKKQPPPAPVEPEPAAPPPPQAKPSQDAEDSQRLKDIEKVRCETNGRRERSVVRERLNWGAPRRVVDVLIAEING